MPATPIVCGHVSAALASSPIHPDWIVGGNPVARNTELARSHDLCSCTIVWDCTPGEFRWHYDIDETIHILEGSIVLDDGAAPPRRLTAGDVVFFPAGAVVHWTVETHVRKLAFFRRPMPKPVAILTRTARGARAMVRRLLRPGPSAVTPDAALAPGMARRADGA